MTDRPTLLAGIELGLLIAAFLIELLDLSQLVVTAGALLVILAAVADSRKKTRQ